MILLRVVLVVVFLLSLAAIVVLAGLTAGSWISVVMTALIVSVISGRMVWKIWRPVTALDSLWVNLGAHTVFFTVFLTALFYTVNYIPAAVNVSEYENATVNKVFREQHYRTRRVGRRVYSRGAPYWVYRAEIKLPDKTDFTVNIPLERYKQLHKGDTVGVPVCRGALGRRIIVAEKIRYPKSTKKRRKHYPPARRGSKPPVDL